MFEGQSKTHNRQNDTIWTLRELKPCLKISLWSSECADENSYIYTAATNDTCRSGAVIVAAAIVVAVIVADH